MEAKATQQSNITQQASPLQAKTTATIATLISAQSQSPQQTAQILVSTFSNVVQTTPQIVPSLMTNTFIYSQPGRAKLNIPQAQLSSITSLQSVVTDMSSKLNTILSKATGENALNKAEISHIMISKMYHQNYH